MQTLHIPHPTFSRPNLGGAGPVETETRVRGPMASAALAGLRVALGFIFLWAFLDKTFGLSYSTSGAKAWIRGGSPTEGFLKSVDVGPLQSFFHSIAGTWWADWLFMMGLLGMGLALVLGITVRLAAVAGVALMAFMWLAEFPLAQHTAGGQPSGSTNPIVDYHFLYALALIVLAVTDAGARFGLGRMWRRMPIVRERRWLQ